MAVALSLLILGWFVGLMFLMWDDITECCREAEEETR